MKTKILLLVTVVLFFGIGAKQAHRLYASRIPGDIVTYFPDSRPLDNILRLHDGQVQRLDPNEGWVCANSEIKRIIGNANEGYIDFGSTDIASCKIDIDWDGWDIDDEFIRSLAKRGRLCEVLGHRWDFQVGDITVNGLGKTVKGKCKRTCEVCGEQQYQQWIEGHWSEWQETINDPGAIADGEVQDDSI